MRSRLDEELDGLMKSMSHMGKLCEQSLKDTMSALSDGNEKKAKTVLEGVETIRREERNVENTCLKLLLQQQPVAKDLRIVSAALKAVYDLERIGIVTGDIAEIISSEHVSCASDLLELTDMGENACSMVTDAIQVFIHKDAQLADAVIRHDDLVDAAFVHAKKLLADKFSRDSNVEYALNLLMIAKYFEKIGDHAVNIAEWAMFAATGVKGGE